MVGVEDILLVRRGSFVCGLLVEVLESVGAGGGGASLAILTYLQVWIMGFEGCGKSGSCSAFDVMKSCGFEASRLFGTFRGGGNGQNPSYHELHPTTNPLYIPITPTQFCKTMSTAVWPFLPPADLKREEDASTVRPLQDYIFQASPTSIRSSKTNSRVRPGSRTLMAP